jgi:hypothetical protein
MSNLDRVDRVRARTAQDVNQRIDEATWARVEAYVGASPAAISARLSELEEEWDVERALETQASTTALLGLLLSFVYSRKWLWLTAINQAFLLMHALWGWCPPIEAQRRLGVRTRREIEVERVALKALRGDFASLSDVNQPAAALVASTRD